MDVSLPPSPSLPLSLAINEENLKKNNSVPYMMPEGGCCCDEAASHQLPIAAAF